MNRTRRLCLGALLTATALLLSWLEHLLPLQLLLPLPGVKLGLANVAVLYALLCLGRVDAWLINGARCLLAGLLFGTPISLAMSLAGGAASTAVSCLLLPLHRREKLSPSGLGVAAAAMHHVGQLSVAAFLTGSAAVLRSYLPVLLLAAVPTGWITGSLTALGLRSLSYERKK